MDVRPTRETGLPEKTGGASTSESPTECPVGEERLMEKIPTRKIPAWAIKRVERNKGGAGVDGTSTVHCSLNPV